MGLFRRSAVADDGVGSVGAPAPSPFGVVPQPFRPGPRELTASDRTGLELLRDHLRASGADVADPRALETLYDQSLDRWSGAPAAERGDPGAVVGALGVGIGDLLVARAPGARWVVDVGPEGPTPAVTTAAGRVVRPLASVEQRWRAGVHRWLAVFVDTATVELTAHSHAEARPAPRTPADLEVPPSPEVQDLALQALARAVDAVVASGRPLAPFAIVRTWEGTQTRSFAGDPGSAERHARRWARSAGATHAAVAWDDPRTVDGTRHDAVVVEACAAGEPSMIVAHRYRAAATGAEPVGAPVVVGQDVPLI